MLSTVLKGKIHRARITGADLDYEGSCAIDQALLEAADIAAFERVEIYNVSNGQRLATYAIPAPRGSGTVALNGAAARCGMAGDLVIIAAYGLVDQAGLATWQPRVVMVDAHNAPLAPM